LAPPPKPPGCREEIRRRPESGVEIVRELDLKEMQLEEFVHLLHEHSINGVILSTRHAHFDRAEVIVNACELEGVEAWLVADFFKTNISSTSLDDFYGRPFWSSAPPRKPRGKASSNK
jgi:hypothetical protein